MAAALLVLLLLLPSSADATAGFAERHSELLYGELAVLDWVHPGDGCDCGSHCFHLMKREPRGAWFPGMERSLGKISAPAETTPPWLMAQACSDGRWIVYDLAAEEVLADTESYESALAVWMLQGLAEPSFADAQGGARGLHQSWRSHFEDVGMLLLMFLPMLVLVSLPACAIASIWLFARYARARRNKDLLWALVVLTPSLPGWWLAWMLYSSMTGARSGENAHQGRATDPKRLARLDRALQLDPIATASEAPTVPAEVTAAANPNIHLQVFAIEESTSTRATVDIGGDGADPEAESPETLQLLDGRGVRLARRIAVRNACSRPSDDPKEPEVCHVVADYAYSGPELERFALAFGASVAIRPLPLDHTPLTREAQLALLARVFDAGFSKVDGSYAAGWQRSDSGNWTEQSYWSELGGAGAPPALEPTGRRFEECSLAAFGAVTEIACPERRTVYLDDRYLGTSDELELGPAVRYAAVIDGVRAYVVIRALNSVTSAVLVLRSGNEWHLREVHVHHGGC